MVRAVSMLGSGGRSSEKQFSEYFGRTHDIYPDHVRLNLQFSCPSSNYSPTSLSLAT